MMALLQHREAHVQCVPCQAQLANAKACAAWRQAVPGTCELTSLRDWSPRGAAPSLASSSRRSQTCRRAVHTAATVDAPEWDVVALGQSMVDISAYVDDVFVEKMGVVKGGRRY